MSLILLCLGLIQLSTSESDTRYLLECLYSSSFLIKITFLPFSRSQNSSPDSLPFRHVHNSRPTATLCSHRPSSPDLWHDNWPLCRVLHPTNWSHSRNLWPWHKDLSLCWCPFHPPFPIWPQFQRFYSTSNAFITHWRGWCGLLWILLNWPSAPPPFQI